MSLPPFRLASVLSYRESRLTEAVREISRIETRLRSLESALVGVTRERDAAFGHAVPAYNTRAADLRLAIQYLAVLEQRELGLRREAIQLTGELTRARATVRERHQEVDILNRLHGRQAEAERVDARRREQRQLDEVAGRQAERRRREGG
ncbi:MAG: flagellar export protein FliJ [Chloroflexota bacterium]